MFWCLRFYNTIISACSKASEWQRALLLLRCMGHRLLEATVVSYNAVTSPGLLDFLLFFWCLDDSFGWLPE